MEKYLTICLFFGVMSMVSFPALWIIGFAGSYDTLNHFNLALVSPLICFWNLFETFDHPTPLLMCVIVTSFPAYWFAIGFLGGGLFSVILEAIDKIKESKLYSKRKLKDENNDNRKPAG